MKSFERVKAATKFLGPDKVPIWKISLGDVFEMAMVPSDKWKPGHDEDEEGLFPHPFDDAIIQAGLWDWEKPDWAKNNPAYEGTNWLEVEREEIDIWGCIWKRKGDASTMGHPSRPSLSDWNKLDDYLDKYIPNPFDKSQYSPFFLDRVHSAAKNKYRACTLGFLGPLQIAANMRGFTTYLIDHKRNPDNVMRLLEYFTQWYIENMDAWIKYGADPHAFILVEDLGTQQGPFLSPKQFEKFYKPVYESIYKAAHERNCDIIQHCCGKIDTILPYLIEWGLDAIELDSPRMTGYNDLREFRGKIMFWGCVNIQSIYTRGTPEECEREVWHMVRNLGTHNGGFGAYFYSQPYHIKVPPENISAFNRGLKKYGVYEKIPESWWNEPVIQEWEDEVVPPLPTSNKAE
jgi:uroporphyrinogen-III decarboxylase